MLFNESNVKGPVRCAVIGIGTMGKRYAAMLIRPTRPYCRTSPMLF